MEKSISTWAASKELGHGDKMDGSVFYSETGGSVFFYLLYSEAACLALQRTLSCPYILNKFVGSHQNDLVVSICRTNRQCIRKDDKLCNNL